MTRGYLGLTVHDWLETLAAEDPVPGSGSAAAIGAATAAAVVAMTARLSTAGGGIAAQALALRSRLVGLADVDADVYQASLEALASATGEGDERRDFALGTALDEAAQAPLMIAESAADVALLAATAASIVKPEVQADARAAAALAAGAAAAAALLVDVNLASTPSDARVRRARAAAERAETAAREAVEGDSLQSAT